MKSKFYSLKSKIIRLRKSGKTYGEINSIIGEKIPKSTLSDWCHSIYLNDRQKIRISKRAKENSQKGLILALAKNKEKREEYLKSIVDRNKHLSEKLKDKNVCKIALAILYLGEGAKNIKRGSLSFGNSDPFVIDLFLNLEFA